MPQIGLGFTTREYNPFSYIIRTFMDCPYSHCFAVGDFEGIGNVMIESDWPYVRQMKADTYADNPHTIFWFDIDENKFDAARKFMFENLGQEFTLDSFLEIALHDIGIHCFCEDNDDTQKNVCSILIARVARIIGFDVCPGIVPSLVDPASLYASIQVIESLASKVDIKKLPLTYEGKMYNGGKNNYICQIG